MTSNELYRTNCDIRKGLGPLLGFVVHMALFPALYGPTACCFAGLLGRWDWDWDCWGRYLYLGL